MQQPLKDYYCVQVNTIVSFKRFNCNSEIRWRNFFLSGFNYNFISISIIGQADRKTVLLWLSYEFLFKILVQLTLSENHKQL